MRPSSNRPSGALWAITSYFNPLKYRRRLENYRVFRDNFAAPLVTVELSFDGEFQLSEGAADILVQLHGGDVMWQKERLLNVAFQSVPKNCDAVAWVDCDVVFDSPDWVERARRALDQHQLVHLFHQRDNLPRDANLNQPRSLEPADIARSIVHTMMSGDVAIADVARGESYRTWGATCGQSWAIRRDVLDRHGMYDACILGGGDRAVYSAALGFFGAVTGPMRMNARRAQHYLSWARRFFATVRGQVGSIPGRVFHLWHGDVKNRRYRVREDDFAPFDFDPYRDITLDANGCWRWSSNKADMHAFLQRYFASRNEDGDSEVLDRHAVVLPTESRARIRAIGG